MKTIKPFPKFTREELADLAVKINKACALRPAPEWTGNGPAPEWTKHPCMIHMGKWEDGKGFHKVKFKGHTLYVHRANWVLFHGHDVPDARVLDHLCRVRRCCQPHHFEPVTVKENNFRGKGNWIYGQGDKYLPALQDMAPPDAHHLAHVAYAHGKEIYGDPNWRDAEILTHAIEHGDPRFVPMISRDVVVPPTHDGEAPALLLEKVPCERKVFFRKPDPAPPPFPRRLKLFFLHCLNRFAGVP